MQSALRPELGPIVSTGLASMKGESGARPAAAVQTCCCLAARRGWIVRPLVPLLGWRARNGLLGRPSHSHHSRPVHYQRAPMAAAASAATGTRRAPRTAPAWSNKTERRRKDDEEAELNDVVEEKEGAEEDKDGGDKSAAAASLRAVRKRSAPKARRSARAGPSAEVRMPWLDTRWLESLRAQQGELDRLQAATKLGTVAEDVRTCLLAATLSVDSTLRWQE